MPPVTPSEAYLAKLARRAFLRAWSYPNLFNDKGCGKELCDLLLVFGEDLVVFSDKHCDLQAHKSPDVAWSRWYKKAVLASAAQALGAAKWIKQHPTRIFADARCTTPLPLPLLPNARVHHVLTVRGAAVAATSEWGGRGSLFTTNRPLSTCSNEPFHLGSAGDSGAFFHVFDEVALDAVVRTLDTAADFIGYLKKREAFFTFGPEIVAAGEEELLGLFLMSFDIERNEIDFPRNDATAIFVDESHWDAWLESPQRAARDSANQISYAWDGLIEKFSHHVLEGTQEFASSTDVAEQEPLLRWLSRESRFRRRVLAENLIEMVNTTPPGTVRRRYHPPDRAGDPYWLFLVFPQPPSVPYDRHRELRRLMLEGHLCVVKHLHPEAVDLAGIAVGESDGQMTEDAMYIDASAWTPEAAEHGRRLHEEQGIFARATPLHQRHWDYPVSVDSD